VTTITVPPPSRVLSPNGDRHHWTKVSKAKKEHRSLVAILAKNQKAAPILGAVEIQVDWYMGNKTFYCPMDNQNAISALKAAIDGIVDAGLIEDDNRKIVKAIYPVNLYRTRKEHQGRSEVVFTIRSAT
jgi:hypothetical protein